jgi:hypothetical protein
MLEARLSEKPLETRIAQFVRLMGSDQNGEVVNAARALGRLLAANNVGFNDLGDAIEKLATGGLEEAAIKRVFDAGYAKATEELERKHAESETVFGRLPNGDYDWERIANYCQRESARIRDAKSIEFINDMAGRMAWGGREPTEKQGKWLISIFRQLGGKVA